MQITAFDLAERYTGIKEVKGDQDHPLIIWWHSLVKIYQDDAIDEIPWCSSFVNGIAWELGLPRTNTGRARHWLNVGTAIPIEQAQRGFDIVIFKRGPEPQPSSIVVNAPGHVAFYHSHNDQMVEVLGGNQGNQVCLSSYKTSRVLGIRRLHIDSH